MKQKYKVQSSGLDVIGYSATHWSNLYISNISNKYILNQRVLNHNHFPPQFHLQSKVVILAEQNSIVSFPKISNIQNYYLL